MIPRIVFGVLMAMVVLTPLPLGSDRAAAWSLIALVTGILLMGWSANAAFTGEMRSVLKLRLIFIPVAMFAMVILWAVVQASAMSPASLYHPVWAEAARVLGGSVVGRITLDEFQTNTALMRLLAYGGVFWLAFALGRSSDRAHGAITILVAAGVVYAAYGFVAFFMGADVFLWISRWEGGQGNFTSTFANRNSYATYAALGLLCSIAGLVDHLHKKAPPQGVRLRTFFATSARTILTDAPLHAMGVILCATALVQTGSRMGPVVALSGLVVLVLGAWLARMLDRRIAGATVAMVVAVAAFAAAFNSNILINRIEAEGMRTEIYEITAQAIRDAPLLGTGYGTYALGIQAYRDFSLTVMEELTRAHGTYLELAAELGLPATILLVGAIVFCVGIMVRGMVTRRRGRIFPVLGIAATVAVGTHALVDFSLQIPAVAVTYAVILGIGCAQSWSLKETSSGRRKSAAD